MSDYERRLLAEVSDEAWRALYRSEVSRGEDLLSLLAERVPDDPVAGAAVLDVGCGDGGVALAFALAGARSCGVDVDPRSLARARLRADEAGRKLPLVRASASALPFPDGAFELVILDNVLEHVPDLERAVGEAARVLCEGGLLYAVTPKPYAPLHVLRDPHHGHPLLVLFPPGLQRLYVEGVLNRPYGVTEIPTRRRLAGAFDRHGFTPLASPRELWLRYLRRKISAPEEVRAGPKRLLARALSGADWAFRGPVLSRLWDAALGANIFLMRKARTR